MKKLTWILLMTMLAANTAWAASFVLAAPIHVGSILSFTTRDVNFNLADNSWEIYAVPAITNKLESIDPDIRIVNPVITVREIVVVVDRTDVMAALGVDSLDNVTIGQFRQGLVAAAVTKVATGLVGGLTLPTPEPTPEPVPDPEPDPVVTNDVPNP